MENDEEKLAEILRSINDSIEDIRNHPADTDKLPSNFEILVKGVASNKAVDALFSSKLDTVISTIVNDIENGTIERILQDKELVEKTTAAIFGDNAFKGPVSNAVLNSLQASVQSTKYQTMKSILGKSMLAVKKARFLVKNLEKQKEIFKDHPEEYEKYKDAIYAIKQMLKFIARVYRGRKIINRKVFDGLSNSVYESYNDYDEAL